ncbi:hypothetical protein BB561_004821 [Smittium simulii]|uniref:t-SNARE coiled-coil homology domain-containing protein n=1 Tax=Smittium simulii TaxID=133385 RepID=A0A2T9YDY8_9FUNG|nr:hypothetical protein BB561_004821 [Smittium simulii]
MKEYSEEQNISRTQKVSRLGRQQGLAKSFGEFVQNYQQANVDFNERNKQRLRRQYLIAKPDATDEEVEEAISSDQVGNVFSSMVMKSSRTAEAKSVLKEVEERHQDILNTEKAILELAGLFQEISDMIYRQQDSLDTIETAVEDANFHIEIAGQEIDQAIEIRKSTRKKAMILLLVLIIVMGIVGGIVYLEVSKK